MRFVVVGAGAIGGVVAAHLSRSGAEVLLVVRRGEHSRAIARGGLTLASPHGTESVALRTADSAQEVEWGDGDIALLAVKSQDTHAALTQLARAAARDVPVACLQNGVANERAALRHFSRVYGVVVMLPATFLQPGFVASHSTPVPGILDVGLWPSGTDELCDGIVAAFRDAGFDSRAVPDVARWKHRKLLNNLSNVVGALCGPDARDGRVTELAREEGLRCLHAAGISYVSKKDDLDRRAGVLDVRAAAGQPRQGNSTWQSMARGVGTVETDYLNGEIVMLGRLHGVSTPVNERLQTLAREHADAGRQPGTLSMQELLAGIRLPG